VLLLKYVDKINEFGCAQHNPHSAMTDSAQNGCRPTKSVEIAKLIDAHQTSKPPTGDYVFKDSNFFSDGKRRIDYVLAFEDDDNVILTFTYFDKSLRK
jgi:hypothetical protein